MSAAQPQGRPWPASHWSRSGHPTRLLLRHGYPPDQQPGATQLVLAQAELIAGEQPKQPV